MSLERCPFVFPGRNYAHDPAVKVFHDVGERDIDVVACRRGPFDSRSPEISRTGESPAVFVGAGLSLGGQRSREEAAQDRSQAGRQTV